MEILKKGQSPDVNLKPIIFVLFLLLLTIFSLIAPADYDIWWHLKTGEYIIQTRSIPRQDIFSYTAESVWTPYSWLAEIIYYLGVSFLGLNFLVFLRAALLIATFGMTALVLSRWKYNFVLTIILSLLFSFLALSLWSDRPYIFSVFFLTIFFLTLLQWEKTKSKIILILPPLMILWANIHINFVYGLALLIYFAVFDLLSIARRKITAKKTLNIAEIRNSLYIFAVSIICALATLFNPFGLRIYREVFRMANMPTSYAVVKEFASPDFHLFYGKVFLTIIILAVIILALSPKKPDPRSMLIFIFILVLSLYSGRNIIFLSILWLPIVTESATGLAEELSKKIKRADVQQAKNNLLARSPSVSRIVIINFFAWLAVVLLAVLIAYKTSTTGVLREYEMEKVFPVRAVEYLRKHPEINGNMFNDYSWGGYIIYKTYPERKVFIDNRNQLFEKSIFKKFTGAIYLTEDWEKLDREYSFDYVIINKKYPLEGFLNISPKWRLVYSDKLASIFIKQ
ncbi:MAG: hypothetical protein M1371_04670 [Actinobacteria bacterium]|nr:hypothetical protein [Actinomycetota bacterium]